MKNINQIQSVYLIGIGGIGMSALAKFFLQKGCTISGYDKTPTAMTDELMASGIDIHFTENIDLIPKQIDLIIYTPAIPLDHAELKYYKENGYLIQKRSEVLQQIAEAYFTIAVAGTHGKTTTSSMLAHILKYTGYDCTAFLGGVTVNYKSNFLLGKNKALVVEADEYDRSFLKLHPEVAIITAVDVDHLDIYGTAEELEKGYTAFANGSKPNAILIVKKDLKIIKDIKDRKVITYSLDDNKADCYAENIAVKNGKYFFDLNTPFKQIKDIQLNMPGRHNIENSVAAASIALQLNIDSEKVKKAIFEFKGVKRRMEYVVQTNDYIYIDDYAHHPVEIQALLKTVREMYPYKKITAIFQPHLYSRTRDLADDFSKSLSMADELILLDIYPAREQPIEGVTSEILLDKITCAHKSILSKKEVLKYVQSNDPELLLTVGAGDIDQLIETVKNILLDKISQKVEQKIK